MDQGNHGLETIRFIGEETEAQSRSSLVSIIKHFMDNEVICSFARTYNLHT